MYMDQPKRKFASRVNLHPIQNLYLLYVCSTPSLVNCFVLLLTSINYTIFFLAPLLCLSTIVVVTFFAPVPTIA